MVRKNRLITDLLREIKNTRSRFVSLLVLSSLAVCFLSGLRATEPDMKRSADRYFDQQRLMDLHIVSTLGVTEEDVSALAAQPGVARAEGAYSVDAVVPIDGSGYIVKVLSCSQEINVPRLVEGRFPQNGGECLVEPDMLRQTGLSIGDKIRLETGEGDFEDALAAPEVTIVGTADSPLYIYVERGSSSLGTGKVSAFVLLPRSGFALDYYTDAYLLAEGALDLDSYSDGYEDKMDALKDVLDPVGEERARLRREEIFDEANEKLTDAEQELADAEREAAEELAEAEQELADARKELDDGWREYRDGQRELEEEIAKANREIADGEQELADAVIELEDGEQEIADAKIELADARIELDDGWAEYEDGLKEWKRGWVLYEDGLRDYNAGKAEYDSGMDQYKSGMAQYQSGVAQLSQAQSQLAQARAALSALQNQLPSIQDPIQQAAVQAQINALRQQIASGEAQIASSQAQLSSTLAQLNAAKAQLDASEPQLSHAKAELERTLTTLTRAKRELRDAEEELNDGEADYRQGQADLAQAERDLAEGWQEYRDGLQELADARVELRDETAKARRELADALEDLNEGEAEYADGLVEYEDGKREADEKIADAKVELEQARRDLDALEDCEWYILDRNTNAGYMSYSMDADRMGNLAAVFPLIFFLVAALVCLTTMTRMVEEQRVTIGGLKALGFSRGAIAMKYVGYGLLASVTGAAIGLAVGLTVIPFIICTAWGIIYTLGDTIYGFYPSLSLTAALAAVATIVLSALWASFSTLTAVPAQLMRPKAPPIGKRVLLEKLPFLWKRFSFNQKITLRNLFRYQKRFWMTVVGIGGCAALTVTAFGLRDSIFVVVDQQYDEIYRYTVEVGLVDQITPGELRQVEEALEQNPLVEDWTSCRSELITAESPARTMDVYLQAAGSQEELERFVNLRHRLDGNPVTLPDDGVVLNEKLAAMLGVKPGDTVILDGDKRVEARVADVTEHYILHYVYMTDAYYETLFGVSPEGNLILADCPSGPEETEQLSRDMVALDGVTTLTRIADTRNTFMSSLASVDYAVVLIIACAAALAFVVLYNLTNINITERMRELATLKVLGFYDGELSAYVYRENVILTGFGVALGMVLGKLLHQWLILTVEIDQIMFGRVVEPASYGAAVLLTVVFSLLVNLAAHRKLKKLDMVESLKTVE